MTGQSGPIVAAQPAVQQVFRAAARPGPGCKSRWGASRVARPPLIPSGGRIYVGKRPAVAPLSSLPPPNASLPFYRRLVGPWPRSIVSTKFPNWRYMRVETCSFKSKGGSILQGGAGAGHHLFFRVRGRPSPVPGPSRHRPRVPGCGGPVVVSCGTAGYYLSYGTGETCLCLLWERLDLW